ncbi:MAG: MBL fold metallo-hydrolase [Muribaculaceae bacterium]|nr:MBL fold metallo-hydrolase [Muribaculaceae bacterium]
MELIMLGTGNALCTRCYNTCFYLRSAGGGLLVDGGGGNGIFRQLRRAGIAVEQLRHIFVTHCHTDHILGVVWLIRKISPLIHKGRFAAPLTVHCHPEAAHALRTMCRLMMSEKICGALDDTIIFHELDDGEEFTVGDLALTAFDIHSTKLKQYGFQAVLPDGQRLVCLGDEPCAAECEHWVAGCDWLLCEAFCLWSERQRFNPYEKHHSTALDAGRMAGRLQARRLVLYHTEDRRLATRRTAYTAEAAQHFTGIVHVPDDLETVELA